MKKPDTLLLNAALRYAELGYLVFPCNGKVPLTSHGFKDATTDPSQIKAWWTKYPDANIGVATGEKSGFFVLDIDVKNEARGFESLAELEREFGELPHTVETITWSGGRHIFFKSPSRGVGCKTGVRPGVDVKGDGGYVIFPPSVIEGRIYEWEVSHHPDETLIAEAPEWLLNLLDAPSTRAASPTDGDIIPTGQRNAYLASLAGTMRRRGMTESEILAALLEVNKRFSPPLSGREVSLIAQSISRYEPDGVAVTETEDHNGATSTPGLDEETPFGPPAPVDTWLDTDPPPVDYLFENLLVAGIVGGVFAAGGTGKTYLILCLILSAALGLPFFMAFRPTRSMRVLGLLGEDPQDMIHRRVRSILGEFRDVDRARFAENLRLYCGHPAPLMKLNGNNPARTAAIEWLKKEVDEFRPGLVVIDPKSMFYGLDENSNDHCTQWVNTLKELSMHGATVLFTHHIAKSAGGTLELTGARGGSALVDGSRFAANMRALTEDDAKRYDIDEPWRYVEFRVTKNSYAPRLPGSVFFKFTEGGALDEVDLEAARESVMIDELIAALTAEAADGNFYTAREVTRMKALLPDATARERKHAVGLAIKSGRLSTEEQPSGKIRKTVLVPEGTGTNKGAQGKVAKGGKNEACDIIV
ncbi:MAG: bifunctional DNA primase/polymerase [bacterium]|nr:bifunctional DNA primase/polymerase [bacterium]